MEKDIIFLAYANSIKDSLRYLDQEYEETVAILNARKSKEGFKVETTTGATRKEIINFLINYRDKLIAFQFSGHANMDTLIFEDEAANSKGIIKLLAQCPKLKLIILNGCSTQKQVKLILDEDFARDPVVISTSAPINDKSAYEYAVAFWKTLCIKNETVTQAHQNGLAAANTIERNQEIIATRDAGFEDVDTSKSNDHFWDISYDSNASYNWTLPYKMKGEEEKVNEILIKRLLESIGAYNEEVKEAKENKTKKIEQKARILKALPLPISEQIRKLFSKESPLIIDEDNLFYNEVNEHRLLQISKAYHTLIETITFIHIAQFWDEYTEKAEGGKPIIEKLKNYFSFEIGEKLAYSLIEICYGINDFFVKNKITNFLAEWNLAETSIKKDKYFNEAVAFMIEIPQNINSYESASMSFLCAKGERSLAIIFSKLAFIVNYTMKSIQGIGVSKYRHKPEKKIYNHSVIELESRFGALGDFEVEPEKGEELRFNDSVFIINSKKEYLNLTPFIIDENSFKEKANIPKIYHLALFGESKNKRKKSTNYEFTHVYIRNSETGEEEEKTKHLYLKVKDELEYEALKAQLNDFRTTFLNITDAR